MIGNHRKRNSVKRVPFQEKDKVNWRQYIRSDPEILLGKPVVRGTRMAVDFILGLFAAGWTDKQVLQNYPSLSPKAIQAVFAYAAECMGEEALYAIPSEAT
jgi:uncharacterized protein (DUF433 family)